MRKPNVYIYPAIFTYEDEGIAVTFPDLNCATCGENDVDAVKSAKELLGLTLFGLEEDNEIIPKPSNFKDIKVEENEVVILIDVFMPSIREELNNKSINRTVTLPAWLNARALENNINFSQLLQIAIKKQLGLKE